MLLLCSLSYKPITPCWSHAQVKTEGVGALYAGLSAALARQASYTTLRLGLYDLLKSLVLDREWKESISSTVQQPGVCALLRANTTQQ